MDLATEVKRIAREEISQAVVRILILLFGITASTAIYLFEDIPLQLFATLAAYLIFACFWWLYVQKTPGDYPFRRRLIAIADLALISYCIHIANDWGAIYFFSYIWVIVGNGMRFGSRALIESVLIGFCLYVIMVYNSPYWMNSPQLTIGLGISMALLPSYFLILINRLSIMSKQLAIELNKANHSATHDALSGLTNRAYFLQRLSDKINEAGRYGERFIVMYLDLDGFKEINDRWGHTHGDYIINTIADRIRNHIRKSDIAARLGGDEFALMLHSIDATFNLPRFTNRLIQKIAEPVSIDGKTLQVTASIGISQFPTDGQSVEALINSADQSMYASKKEGRNRFTLSSALPLAPL